MYGLFEQYYVEKVCNTKINTLNESEIIQEGLLFGKEKFNITKEEILKDPNGTVEKLKHKYDPKNKNLSDTLSFLSFGISILSCIATANPVIVIPSGLIALISGIIGIIIDEQSKKGNKILVYSKEKKEADQINSTIKKEISILDSAIKKCKDQKKLSILKKQKEELEKILKRVREYKNEQDFFKTTGLNPKEIEYARSEINGYINKYKDNDFYFGDINIEYFSSFLWYCDIQKKDFDKWAKSQTLDYDIQDEIREYYDENNEDVKKFIEYLDNNPYIEVAYEDMSYLIYIPGKKEFIDVYLASSINSFKKYTFESLKSDGANIKEFKEKEYIYVDAELGYYRLSEPEKEEDRKLMK